MARPKIYLINSQYFEEELNEHKAYLLGLIYSDGHLSYKHGAFQYNCSSSDIELLEFIRAEFNSSHPIKFYKIKNREYARYSFRNKSLVHSIILKFNMPLENKSQNNLIFPNEIPDNLICHFLRGISDGDGSIWRGKNDTFSYAFTGGENFMNQIKEIILEKTGVKMKLRYRYSKENCNSCSIETKGSINVSKIGNFLYNNSTIFLLRKKIRFDECNELAMKRFKYNGNNEKIQALYLNGTKQIDIAKLLNANYSSVRSVVQHFRKMNHKYNLLLP